MSDSQDLFPLTFPRDECLISLQVLAKWIDRKRLSSAARDRIARLIALNDLQVIPLVGLAAVTRSDVGTVTSYVKQGRFRVAARHWQYDFFGTQESKLRWAGIRQSRGRRRKLETALRSRNSYLATDRLANSKNAAAPVQVQPNTTKRSTSSDVADNTEEAIVDEWFKQLANIGTDIEDNQVYIAELREFMLEVVRERLSRKEEARS